MIGLMLKAFSNAPDGGFDVFGGVGVGKTQIAFAEAPETGARQGGDAGFVQKLVLKLPRCEPQIGRASCRERV